MIEEKSKGIKKIPLKKFAFPVTDKGIGEANTVSNGPDDGTLNKLAARFWNVKRHGSTQQAVDNLLIPVKLNVTEEISEEFSSSGGCNIGGHGFPGGFETGCGQKLPFDTNKWIIYWNEGAWGPQLNRLVSSPLTMITVWGCHVGAEQAGADLLYAMATHTGRAVRSGTAFLWVNDQSLWWGNGSQWQVATPLHKPTAIPQPDKIMLTDKIEFQIGKNIFEMHDIEKLDITTMEVNSTNTSEKHLKGNEAQLAAEKMFTSSALDMKGLSTMGVISSKLSVTFKSNESIDFDIYNDGLAVDEKSETGYYINSTFRKL